MRFSIADKKRNSSSLVFKIAESSEKHVYCEVLAVVYRGPPGNVGPGVDFHLKTVICRSNHTREYEIDLDLRTFARPWGARTLSLVVFWVDGYDTELRQLA